MFDGLIAMARMEARLRVLLGVVLATLEPTGGLFAAERPFRPGQVFTNGIGMKLIGIPAGEFMQGVSGDQDAEAIESERPAHRVKISKPFYFGVYEVTQMEYRTVMSEAPWTGRLYVQEGDAVAASYVSWEDATAFCKKLSQREGRTYRLPTEAEWEYACRAGTKTVYSFGDKESRLGGFGWYTENADDAGGKFAQLVGQKPPNPFGLYDMHGNAYEWCQDVFDAKAYGKRGNLTVDPLVTSGSRNRVTRGGSWKAAARLARSSCRTWDPPSHCLFDIGFRVVCDLR
jgi:formylglycine-generating enzyme required for sulfatase activity